MTEEQTNQAKTVGTWAYNRVGDDNVKLMKEMATAKLRKFFTDIPIDEMIVVAHATIDSLMAAQNGQ
jgi:hypothetical protein